MKSVKIFALSSAGLLWASIASAAPQIYGAIYVNADASYTQTKTTYADGTVTKDSGRDRVKVYDNASRIGVRGSEPLTSTVDLAYRMEWRAPFDVDTRTLEPRDAWLGLSHKKYGTLKAGRLLTYDAYLNDMPWGRPAYMDGLRTNNSFRYESPTIKGVQATAQYIMDENTDSSTAGTDSINGDGYAVSLNYSQDKYNIGAAYVYADADDLSDLRGVLYVGLPTKDALRINGAYQISPTVKFAGMYQQNRFNGLHYGAAAKTEKALALAVSHTPKDKNLEMYSQVNLFDNQNGVDGEKFDVIFGAKKDFGAKTYAGVELFYYHDKTNVPAHTDDSGNAVQAHKIDSKSTGVSLYSGFRF